jgi:hypothetical protein
LVLKDATVDDKPIPRYQKVVAGGLIIAIILLLVFEWGRVRADFWPLDSSRVGPNLVASVVQWAIILVVVVLLWPPTRRRIHQFTDKKLRDLHEAEKRDRQLLHKKLDHIIKESPDIGEFREDDHVS